MKIITITQICKSKHLPDAMCRKSPPPPRCTGCKVDCSKFDKLMIQSTECNRRRMLESEANYEG